jgi:hypothetical protein
MMADLEGPLLSLRNDIHVVTGRFIDDNIRADRANRSRFRINEILLREDMTGTDRQVEDLRSASDKIAPVKSGQNKLFDDAMDKVVEALRPL